MVWSFRKLVAWQLAFELNERVEALLKQSPEMRRDFRFRDQLQDSARSVSANIAEGFGRFNPAEAARFAGIARGSLDETESHLRDGVSKRYFDETAVGPLIHLAARTRVALGRWHAYLRSVRHDPRFRPK